MYTTGKVITKPAKTAQNKNLFLQRVGKIENGPGYLSGSRLKIDRVKCLTSHAVMRRRKVRVAYVVDRARKTTPQVSFHPSLQPDPTSKHSGLFSVFPTVWRNRFLFWAVVAGFVVAFPVIYLPFINRIVFKHSDITWEWGVVFGCVAAYLSLVETWKAIKRRFGIGSGKHRRLTCKDAEKRAGLEHIEQDSMVGNEAEV